MKIKTLSGILTVTVAVLINGRSQTRASIVLLSDDLSVKVTGVAAGQDGSQSFSQSQNQSSTGPVAPNGSVSVSGSGNWTDSTSQSYYADGSTWLKSEISDTSIFAQIQMNADASAASGGSYGPSSAQGQSTFELTFLVQTPQQYNLSFNAGGFVYFGQGSTLLNLTDPGHDGSGQFSLGNPNEYTYAGVMDPGVYTISWGAYISADPDPNGSESDLYDNMHLSVTPVVPDATSTLALMFMPLGLFALALACGKVMRPV